MAFMLFIVCIFILCLFFFAEITEYGKRENSPNMKNRDGSPIEFYIHPETKLVLWLLFGFFVFFILTIIYLFITEML